MRIVGWRRCWLLRDHCSERSLVISIRRLNTQFLPHFFPFFTIDECVDLGSSEEHDDDENVIQKTSKNAYCKRSTLDTPSHHWLHGDFPEQWSMLKRSHSSSWWSWWTFSCPLVTTQTCPVYLIGRYRVTGCPYPLWIPLLLPEEIAFLFIKLKCFISETDNSEKRLLWNDQCQLSENTT